MSGIAGIVHAGDRPVDRTALSRMVDSLAVRGPDGNGIWTDGSTGFGYSLLGTPVRAQRSLAICGQLAIAADARIDAKDDLLRQFDPSGRGNLSGATDAELILESYRRWGFECLGHLIGDFSFAIWDGRTGRLFCARDQFGVKPFFYSSTLDSFVFSNSLDALRIAPGVRHELDRQAIADFLLFGQYQDNAATAFANLRRLPAGHSLTWHSGTAEVHRYWTLPVDSTTRFARSVEYIDGFRELAERAVSDRLHPDRTSILMSGGLDSTMVAALAAGNGREVKSFAIVYDRLIPDEERHYAQLAADALEIPLQCLSADDYQLFQRTAGTDPATPEPVDEPLPAVFNDHLSQVAAYSNIALSGVGGDPLLFPSPRFAARLMKSGKFGQLAGGVYSYARLRHGIPPLGFRGALLRTFGLRKDLIPLFPPWLNQDLTKDLGLRERWERAQCPPETPAHPDRPDAYKILTDPAWPRIFESYDAGVTRIPVEVRHPLFDVRLVKYCLGLPPIPWCVDKTLARAAMLHCLPDAVRLRPKSFSADGVAPRLAASAQVDSWDPSPELAQFVDRSLVPVLAQPGASWDPHLRPFALNEWMKHLTTQRG